MAFDLASARPVKPAGGFDLANARPVRRVPPADVPPVGIAKPEWVPPWQPMLPRKVGVRERSWKPLASASSHLGAVLGQALAGTLEVPKLLPGIYPRAQEAQDVIFSNVVAPYQRVIEANKLKAGEELTGAATVSEGLQTIAPYLVTGGMTGLAAARFALARPLAAKFTGAQGFALPMTLGRATELTHQGVPTSDVLKTAAASYPVNTVAGMLPLSTPGGVIKRAGVGGLAGLISGEAAAGAEQLALPPEHQDKAIPMLNPANMTANTALSSVLAAALGPRYRGSVRQSVRSPVATEETTRMERLLGDEAPQASKASTDSDGFMPGFEPRPPSLSEQIAAAMPARKPAPITDADIEAVNQPPVDVGQLEAALDVLTRATGRPVTLGSLAATFDAQAPPIPSNVLRRTAAPQQDRPVAVPPLVRAAWPRRPLPPAKTSAELESRIRRGIINAIDRMGGLEIAERSDIAGESSRRGGATLKLFRNGGYPIDRAAELFAELGYLKPDDIADVAGGAQAARDMIRAAIQGEPIVPLAFADEHSALKLAEREADEIGNYEAEQAGIEQRHSEIQRRAEELLPEAEREALAVRYENDAEYFAAAQERLDEFLESPKTDIGSGDRASTLPRAGENRGPENQGAPARSAEENTAGVDAGPRPPAIEHGERLYSRDVAPDAGRDDSLFVYQTAKGKDLETVAAEIDPGFRVAPLREPPADARRAGIEAVQDVLATTGDRATVHFYRDGRIGVDASDFKSGHSRGNALASMLMDLAYNTNRVFVGDPGRLSPDAIARLPQLLLSSAVKHGTTKHLWADPKLGIQWGKNDEQNARQLAELAVKTVLDSRPEFASARYNESLKQFEDSDGLPITRVAFQAAADSEGGTGAARAGGATLARAVYLNSILRGAGPAGGDGLLAKLAGIGGAGGRVDKALKGLFYSREAEVGTANTAKTGVSSVSAVGRSADALRRELSDSFGKRKIKRLQDSGLLELAHSRDHSDLHADTKGFWDGSRAVLLHDRIAPGMGPGVLMHEVGEHAGMEKMLGSEKYQAVQTRFDALVEAKDPAALKARDAVPGDTNPAHVRHERLAYLIELVANAKDRSVFSKAVRDLVQEAVARMRAWAYKTLPAEMVKGWKLSPRDIAALARRSVEFVAEGGLNTKKSSPQDGFVGERALASRTTDSEVQKSREQLLAEMGVRTRERALENAQQLVTKGGNPLLATQAQKALDEARRKAGFGSDFALAAQTEADLTAKAAREKAATTQRPAANVPVPESFTLTGSDRDADVGASAGQGRLFSRASQTDTPEFRAWSELLGPSGMSGLMKTVNDKTIMDRLKRNSEFLSDFLKGEAIGVQSGSLSDIPASVISHVVAVTENTQILRAVVSALPVNVVDFIRRKQLSPERVLRNEAMLKNMLAVDSQSPVSLRVNESIAASLVQSVARSAAEIASLAGRPLERNAASSAGAGNSVLRAHEVKDVTKTPEFSRWFGDSKVVDENGEPLVVYHGTADNFDIFEHEHENRKDNGWLGRGFYFWGNHRLANEYASHIKAGKSPNVMPVYLNLQNPYIAALKDKERLMLSSQKGGDSKINAWTEELKARGHDGVILKYEQADKPVEYVVFERGQIKSAIGNRGTFDPKNPNILFSMATADIRERAGQASLVPREPGPRTAPVEAKGRIAQAASTLASIPHYAAKVALFRPVQVLRDGGTQAEREFADRVMLADEAEDRLRADSGGDLVHRRYEQTGKFETRLGAALQPLEGRWGIPKKKNDRLWSGLTSGNVPASLADAAVAVARVMREARAYGNAAGLGIGEIQNYLPRVFLTEKVMLTAPAFRAMLMRNGRDANEANAITRNIINGEGVLDGFYEHDLTGNVPFKSGFQKERSLADIPDSELAPWLERDVAALTGRYVSAIVRRAEWARIAGPKGEHLDAALRAAIEEDGGRRSTEEIIAPFRDLSDSLQGVYKPIEHRGLNLANRAAMNLSVMMHLPFAQLNSIAETFAPLLTGEVSAASWLKGAYAGGEHALRESTNWLSQRVLAKRVVEKSKTTREAEEFGLAGAQIMLDAISQASHVPLTRSTQLFMRATLLPQLTNMQRVMAYRTMQAEIASHAAKLAAGKEVTPFMRRFMADYGLDEAALRAWGGEGRPDDATFLMVARGAQRFAQRAITVPNEATRPIALQNPRFAFFWQFQSFAHVFANNVLRRTIKQMDRNLLNALRGDADAAAAVAKPLATAVLMVTTSFFIQDFRDWLKYGDKAKDKKVGDDLLNAIDRSGLTGPVVGRIYRAANPYRTRPESAQEKLVSQAGAIPGTIARGFNVYGTKKENDANQARFLVSKTPLANMLPYEHGGKQLSKTMERYIP